MMQNTIDSLDQGQSLALETAWQRYAQLKANALEASRQYRRLRGWIIVLAIVTTLLAVVTSHTDSSFMASPSGKMLTASLVLLPIIVSIIFVVANKLQQGEYWQVLSIGAEEIKKEIYLYRTLLQGQPQRHQWLNQRITTIQRQVLEKVGGNLVLKPYNGKVPPDYPNNLQNSDPGLSDLQADDYLAYRLDAQLEYYSQELARLNTTKTRLQIGILAFGGLSAFVASLGGSFNVWVAFTTSIAAGLTIWLEVCRLDPLLTNYNQLILELTLIRDYWQSLSQEERTDKEFFNLVIATEKLLWSEHNQNVIQMLQVVADWHKEANELLIQVMNTSLPQAKEIALLPKKPDDVKALPASEEIQLKEAVALRVTQKEEQKKPIKKGLPHAFVVMPFGRKKGPDGRWIDFDSIYQKLIKPALEEAGFEPFRADEETVSGDILTDMFQELLLADLVIADLSIDNANVFYELGIRHALRKRGLVHIQCGRAYMPYDIFNVRTLPYQCDENGCPDPRYLEKDKQAIIKMARETWDSNQSRIHSPIFNLLTGLCEPDRKVLKTPLAKGYWQEYEEWQEYVTIAQRQKRIGDVLLLAEEVKNPLIKEDAIADAGEALNDLGNHALALKEYRQGLKLNPNNLQFRRAEAFHLSQLKQFDEAIVKLERLLQDEPNNIETRFYLAHIYVEGWIDEWKDIKDEQERLKVAYESADLLIKGIKTYIKCYRLDQNHYASGLRALVLLASLDHIAQQVNADSDPDEEALKQQLPILKGAVQFSLESAARRDANNFWLFISLGAFTICTADEPKQVTRAYKKALTLAGKNQIALKSALTQLKLMRLVKFRFEYVEAGIAVLETELKRLESQEKAVASYTDHEPAKVFLFSGHMIDRPGRETPRFPAAMESEARQRIEQVLDKLETCENCLAIAPGAACGGDILFIEACLQHNMKVEVFLPFPREKFIEESVRFAGDEWVERFYELIKHPQVTIHLQPERLGQVPAGDDPFTRNNRWALYSTLMYGIERVRLVALWDGKEGQAGGTGDMVQQVRQLGGVVEHLDTTKFDYWKVNGKVLDFAKTTVMSS